MTSIDGITRITLKIEMMTPFPKQVPSVAISGFLTIAPIKTMPKRVWCRK